MVVKSPDAGKTQTRKAEMEQGDGNQEPDMLRSRSGQDQNPTSQHLLILCARHCANLRALHGLSHFSLSNPVL